MKSPTQKPRALLLLAVLSLLLQACPQRRGDAPVGPPAFGPDLRDGSIPTDAADRAWHAWVVKGDSDAAYAAFQEQTEGDRAKTARPEAIFGLAESQLHRARFTEALETHRRLLEGHPEHPLAIWSALRMWQLRDHVPGWSARVDSVTEALRGHRTDPLVRSYLGLMQVLAEHRRVRASGRGAVFDGAQVGFAQYWRVAGPFSIYGTSDIDLPFEADDDEVLADTYLVTGFERETRDVLLDNPRAGFKFALTGVYVMETFIKVESRTEVVASWSATAGGRLWVDDQLVFARDLSTGTPPRHLGEVLTLGPGVHRVRVRLGVTAPETQSALVLTPSRGEAKPMVMSPTRPQGPTGTLGRASDEPTLTFFDPLSAEQSRGHAFLLWLRAIWAEDVGATAAGLHSLDQLRGLDVGFSEPAIVLATLLGRDEGLPPQVRDERALSELKRAVDSDPTALAATDQLAYMLYTQNQSDEALALLDALAERVPGEYLIDYHRYMIYRERGWTAQAAGMLRSALNKHPSHCLLIDELWTEWDRVQNRPAPGDLPAEFFGCDSTFENLAEHYDLPRGDVKAAIGRFEILAKRNPSDTRRALQLAHVYALAGDHEQEDRVLRQAADTATDPDDIEMRQIDSLLAQGHLEQAHQLAESLISDEPGNYMARRRLGHMDRVDVLDDLRIDGDRIIDAYKAKPVGTDASAVFLLDYAATRVFSDGSSLTNTHLIIRVNNKEGIDRFAEVSIPAGALLMAIRTVKADGRGIEPEIIDSKETISMASLAPGDFIDYEYIEGADSSLVSKGSYLGFRFVFSIFDAPLLRSEYVVELPKDWTPTIDRRGGLPEPEVTPAGAFRRYRFVVTNSPRTVAEPNSAPATEFVPSVIIGHRYGWADAAKAYRDTVLTLSQPSERALSVAREATDGLEGLDEVKALLDFVVRNINDDGSGPFAAPAKWVINTKSGDRLIALHTLLNIAGIDNEVVLARPWDSDQTESEVPEIEKWGTALLRVTVDGESVWLDPSVKFARFGYIDPIVQGARALRLGDLGPNPTESSLFVTLPTLPPGSDRRAVTLEIEVDDNGDAHGSGHEIYTGSGATQFRRVIEHFTDPKDLVKAFTRSMAESFPGLEVETIDFENEKASDEPLTLTYRFHSRGFARRTATGLTVDRAIFPTHLDKVYASLPRRTAPLGIVEGLQIELRTHIAFPDGATVKTVSNAVARSDAYGKVERTVASDDNTIAEERLVQMGIQRIQPERYAGFRTFAQQVGEAERLKVDVVLP